MNTEAGFIERNGWLTDACAPKTRHGWLILNPHGSIWSDRLFPSAEDATAYLREQMGAVKGYSLVTGSQTVAVVMKEEPRLIVKVFTPPSLADAAVSLQKELLDHMPGRGRVVPTDNELLVLLAKGARCGYASWMGHRIREVETSCRELG